MGRTITNVDRTCGPTHLLVFSGNKICLNYVLQLFHLFVCSPNTIPRNRFQIEVHLKVLQYNKYYPKGPHS